MDMCCGGVNKKSHKKLLKNNNKSNRLTDITRFGIRNPTGIYDKTGKEILVGDMVEYDNNRRRRNVLQGRVLWHYLQKCYCLAMDKNEFGDEYDLASYHDAIIIPSDNGMRMHLKIIE